MLQMHGRLVKLDPAGAKVFVKMAQDVLIR